MADYADLYNLDHPQPSAPPQPEATPARTTPDRGKEKAKRPRKPGIQEPGKPVSPPPADATGAAFDINAERDAKVTVELTKAEYAALVNLKLPLGFQFDTRITLNDLVRCAINLALEDYRAQGDQSFLIHHLSQKKAK